MNIIHSLLLLLMGNSNESKDILSKKPTKEDHIKNLECWIGRHFNIICFLAIVFVLILFVLVCYALVGVSATESGIHYNHIGDVI